MNSQMAPKTLDFLKKKKKKIKINYWYTQCITFPFNISVDLQGF